MRGIQKRFGATVALAGVDLAVEPGQVLALVGENGAGKSTLMKILSGACTPDAGEMWLDGQPYRPRNPHDARLLGVAMIYQELSLAPHLSVAGNIMLGMEPQRLGCLARNEMREKSRVALRELGLTDLDLDGPVNQLSLAVRQMVEIARGFAIGCRVLVLDEPTSSLSADDIQRLFALVRRLRDRGHAIIYISHFLEEVKAITDCFTLLRDGMSVGTGRTADVSIKELVALMVGREVTVLYPRNRRQPGEVVLEVSELAGITRPKQATLTLRRGEVFGIAGLIGAGRTEFFRVLFGLDPIRRGKIKFLTFSGLASPAQRWRQRMGFVSEDRRSEGLAFSLNISDNLTLANLDELGWLGVVSPFRKQRAAEQWIQRLGIKCRGAIQNVGELSGGNQQKVALARLLHHDVSVSILDKTIAPELTKAELREQTCSSRVVYLSIDWPLRSQRRMNQPDGCSRIFYSMRSPRTGEFNLPPWPQA